MAVKYLASKRITGTNAERTAESLPSGTYAGWKEVGRFTATGTISSMPVTSLPDKRYYMYLSHYTTNADGQRIEMNSDEGGNYSQRFSTNGASDSTGTSQSNIVAGYGGSGLEEFNVGYIVNKSNQEKLTQTWSNSYGGSGAGNAPNRRECIGKWANTSEVIDELDFPPATSTFQSGSEVVVLGYDPTDTNTTDFWTEITPQGGVKLSSVGNTLTTGTISSYKYLWLQAYVENSSNVAYNVRFNGVAGSDYAERYNVNGGSDPSPITSGDAIFGMLSTAGSSSVGHPIFLNMFIVNIEGKEKLVIGHSAGGSSGAGNAPNRMEIAGKWADTDSITEISIVNDIGSAHYTTSSVLKVWGSN